MAFDIFTGTEASDAPAAASSAPPSTAGSFNIFSGNTKTTVPSATIPSTASLVANTKTPDASNTFTKLLGISGGTSLKLSSKVANSTPSGVSTSEDPDQKSRESFGIASPLGQEDTKISATKPQGILDSITNTVQNLLTREDPQRDAVVGATQKVIVDNNLYDIGRQLGIDKQIPVDSTKDPSVQDYYHRLAVANYVRNNYDSIRSNLIDPTTIPNSPEKLGPLYSDVDTNLDAYSTALGIRNQPTKEQVLAYALVAPIAGGLVTAPIATLLGLAAFSALGEAEHYFLGDSVANKVSDAIGANSGTRDVLNLIELFAEGAALHQVYVRAPDIATKFTKQVVETYRPGTTISFDPAKIHSVLSGGVERGEISKEESDLISQAVGSQGEGAWKNAIKNGTTIDVAPEKVVRMVDQKWWVKVKNTINAVTSKIGVPKIPATDTPISTQGGKASVGAEARPNRLLGDGMRKIQPHVDVLESEVKDSLEKHGPAATRVYLSERYGLDPDTANKVITNVTSGASADAVLAQVVGKFVPVTPTAKDFIAQKNKETSMRISQETRQKALGGQMEDKRLTDEGTKTVYRAGSGTIKKGDFVTDSKARVSAYHGLREGSLIATQEVPSNTLIKGARTNEYIYAPKDQGTASVPEVKPETPESDGRTPKLTERIEQRLRETFEDVPQYQGMSMKDQSEQVGELIKSDYERAKRIAKGDEEPPKGLRIGSVFKGVELKALQDGDKETLRELALSKTTRIASSYGQEIKAFDGRDPNSPVDAIASIAETREKHVQARQAKLKNQPKTISEAKKNIVKTIKSDIEKSATKETWTSFVDSITC